MNRALLSLIDGYLKITLTVPLSVELGNNLDILLQGQQHGVAEA